MTRRIALGGIGGTVAVLADACLASPWYMAPAREEAWTKIPSIAVILVENDARLTAVYDAVAFWNAMLRNIGSSFRLGRLTRNTDAVLYEDLRKYSDLGSLGDLRAFSSADAFGLNDRIVAANEDIVMLLSDRATISFARNFLRPRKALIVIGNYVAAPFARRNAAHNIIAHELGHAIGLGHNGVPESLMCGGSAACSVEDPEDDFLPLTRGDTVKLLAMYPPGWQSEASRG